MDKPLVSSNTEDFDRLIYECNISANYNHARATFYHSCHSLIQFLIFSLSLIVPVAFVRDTGWLQISGGIVSIIALVSLVWVPHQKYHMHQKLYEDFVDLLGDMECSSRNNEKIDYKQEKRDLFALRAQEPLPYRALVYICARNAEVTLYGETNKSLRWYHRALAHFWRFSDYNFGK